jgi:hypothetical protein
MPILFDDGLLYELAQNRVLTITGRLGSGKTRLAIEIATHFLRQGYKLITNIRTVYADPVSLDYEKVVLLVDEGGLFVRKASDAMKLAAYARKLNMVIIFSGKKLPHGDLCDLQVAMFIDLWKNFLIPLSIWRWEYFPGGGVRPYGGYLFQIAPWWYNATYDTVDPGKPPETIIAYAFERAKRLFDKYGYTLPGLDIPDTFDFRELERAAQKFDQSVRRLRK